MSHWADRYIRNDSGHFAAARSCTVCNWYTITRKPIKPGKGWGLRVGNQLRGEAIQHVKTAHPQLAPQEERC